MAYQKNAAPVAQPQKSSRFYSVFFLYVEPISALAGAYYAYFYPSIYLQMTHPASSPTGPVPPLSTSIALHQLANLYVLFALNEALVLRATSDLRVWRALLFVLLVADLGHLWSVRQLGSDVYWRAWDWNSMMWGNIGFVYMGALTRILFLSGVGVRAAR